MVVQSPYYMYRLTHGSFGVTRYTRGGQLYNTRGPKALGCYKLTTEGIPVMPGKYMYCPGYPGKYEYYPGCLEWYRK